MQQTDQLELPLCLTRTLQRRTPSLVVSRTYMPSSSSTTVRSPSGPVCAGLQVAALEKTRPCKRTKSTNTHRSGAELPVGEQQHAHALDQLCGQRHPLC